MLFIGIAIFRPTRNLLKRIVPKQGKGPSRDTLDNGFLQMSFIGSGKCKDGSIVKCETQLALAGADPGYKGTGIMLVEAALCLALDKR